MPKLVSVVIPTFNRIKELTELVDSLVLINKYKDVEIIIVDNNSKDINYLKFLEKYKPYNIKVKLLTNFEESALSKSRNMGIEEASGDFIFFIDDDNVVTEEVIEKLVKVTEADNTIGAVAPVALYYNERNKVLDAGAMRNYLNSFTINVFLNEDKERLPPIPFAVSEISNAFIVRSIIFKKIGMFDALNFPIDLDEADLCLRVKKAGYKILVVPQAHIYHKVFKINTLSIISLRFRREKNAYYMGRNRVLFQRKHLSWWQYAIFLVLYLPIFYGLYFFSSLLPQPESSLLRRLKFISLFTQGVSAGLAYESYKLA